MNDKLNLPVVLPTLALRGITVFPNMLLHFDVSREASIKALEEALATGQSIFLVVQRNLAEEDPTVGGLYGIGTISTIRQILHLPGDNVRVLVEGVSRGKLCALLQTAPYLTAQVEELPVPKTVKKSPRTEALIRQTYALFESYSELTPRVTPEVLLNIISSDDPGYIADYIAQNIGMRVEEKQAVLEDLKPIHRLERLYRSLQREVEVLQLEEDVQKKVHVQMSENQKDYILREQLKVLRSELGEDDDGDCAEYREKIRKGKLPGEVAKKLLKEVDRLEKQPVGSSEAAVSRNYLDVCLELPWTKKTKERANVERARKLLDAGHFGLDKVKERILEFIAVRQLAPELKGQIICLVGPPGVGKTSIGMSVAKALGRKMARISLGGIHDEAEIRGHRKTYIGAMPGRIMAGIRQAGSANPVLLLDEIDKLGTDRQGDPSSALLEVLDAEQNSTFRDHYLELPFDLSEVLFITTANTTDTIPRPLLDRMEVIRLPSYTDEEKLQIAKRYLLKKEQKRHGLKAAQLTVSDEAVLQIITSYTGESGVRQLERQLATLCRKSAMNVVSDGVKHISITPENLETYLGVPQYHREQMSCAERVGVVNGLAWTEAGGELLEVECSAVPGTGKLELTGNLGDVMRESAKAALTYIRSRARALGIEEEFYKNRDIHLHFPEGAVPKDGPSAGVAIVTALVSALTGTPVKRGIAMTGEVTLRGRVLPIGGLREKTMAALRNGIHTVIIPAENQKDLQEIDQTVREKMHFIFALEAGEVLAAALAQSIETPLETPLQAPSLCEEPLKKGNDFRITQ